MMILKPRIASFSFRQDSTCCACLPALNERNSGGGPHGALLERRETRSINA